MNASIPWAKLNSWNNFSWWMQKGSPNSILIPLDGSLIFKCPYTNNLSPPDLELFWIWDLIKMQKPEKICIRHQFFRPPSRRLEQVLFWQIVQACVKVPSKCHFWGAFSKSCRFCGKKLQYKFVKFCMAEVASFILQVVTTKSAGSLPGLAWQDQHLSYFSSLFIFSPLCFVSVPMNEIALTNTEL